MYILLQDKYGAFYKTELPTLSFCLKTLLENYELITRYKLFIFHLKTKHIQQNHFNT